jgi:hypothetical protein
MGVDVSTQRERERMAVRPREVLTGSKEFKVFLQTAVLKDLRGDWLSMGRDVTLRVLKEAWGPMVQGIAAVFTERLNQTEERGHLRTAG